MAIHEIRSNIGDVNGQTVILYTIPNKINIAQIIASSCFTFFIYATLMNLFQDSYFLPALHEHSFSK